MVSQRNLFLSFFFFLFNLFDLFNYRHLKINSNFFLLWLKGSQRWYSGWSDHGFKSGLPLFKPSFGRVEFSIASSPENRPRLFLFICCFGIILTAVCAFWSDRIDLRVLFALREFRLETCKSCLTR